jgi:hypothetical protein
MLDGKKKYGILVDILMLEIQKKLQILSSVDGLAGK